MTILYPKMDPLLSSSMFTIEEEELTHIPSYQTVTTDKN